MAEIKPHVQSHPEHHGWLANYLVVKRVCTQPNFHDLYLELVKQLEVGRVESENQPEVLLISMPGHLSALTARASPLLPHDP